MCNRAENIRAVVTALISEFGTAQRAAMEIGVVPAHFHNAFERDSPPPTLEAALVRTGYIEPRPTRTRLAIDCEREARRWFRDEAARREMSGEAFLLYMRRCMEREEGRS